jgi:hypothetical protein
MADYMIQISYSAAAWVALIAKPENRLEAVEKVGEKLGGKVGSFWFSFGDHEGDSPSSSWIRKRPGPELRHSGARLRGHGQRSNNGRCR